MDRPIIVKKKEAAYSAQKDNITTTKDYKADKKVVFHLAILICSFSCQSLALTRQSKSLIKDSPKETIDQVWQIIYRDYLDYSGEYNASKWIKLRKKVLSSKYINKEESYKTIREMLSTLKDPYTRFLDPKEFDEMRIDTTGELMGVGIQISLDKENNNIVVVSPIEDTPAYKAGVKPNDVIISIDGKSTLNMSINNAVKLIRGKKGSKVNLGLKREGKLIKVSLTRARIEINAVSSRLNTSNPEYKIGYIRLKQFNAKASKEMRENIKKLETQRPLGYILDLRSNPGGLLEASIDIARQWINQGIIVSTKTKDGITDIRRANGQALTSKPVIILVNESSASASEILSGAIQDNKRGIILGKKTFGKGLVQSVRALSDGSGLTVTVAKYLTPKGKDINKFGILPDIEYELSLHKGKKLSGADLGTKKDSQYIKAENILIKNYIEKRKTSSFNPSTSNLISALSNDVRPCLFSYTHTNLGSIVDASL